jgi:hypothetical protein
MADNDRDDPGFIGPDGFWNVNGPVTQVVVTSLLLWGLALTHFQAEEDRPWFSHLLMGMGVLFFSKISLQETDAKLFVLAACSGTCFAVGTALRVFETLPEERSSMPEFFLKR